MEIKNMVDLKYPSKNNELINIISWYSKRVTCNDIICNTMLEIDENSTYYIFILVNLDGRRSNVTNVVKTEKKMELLSHHNFNMNFAIQRC